MKKLTNFGIGTIKVVGGVGAMYYTNKMYGKIIGAIPNPMGKVAAGIGLAVLSIPIAVAEASLLDDGVDRIILGEHYLNNKKK